MPKTLPNGLVVYTTQDWGAKPPEHAFAPTTPDDVILHHMDWPNRAPITAGTSAQINAAFDVARRCQQDHMVSNGWADTGQHFTVTIDGIVLEGRHGSLDALLAGHCIRGAHAADSGVSPPVDDNNSWGTEHEGTFITATMNLQQWTASVMLQAAITLFCQLDTATIKGHRDTGCSTACPGDWFESQIPRFREETHTAKLKLLAAHR